MLGLSQAQSNLLSEYKWQNRIILLFADSSEDPLFQQQKRLLEDYSEGLLERDLVLFEIFESTVVSPEGDLSEEQADDFRKYFSVKEGFTLLLIGKDGGVKRSENTIVPAEDLFLQIDAMPMRIREMQ